jgi:hypothetical protein
LPSDDADELVTDSTAEADEIDAIGEATEVEEEPCGVEALPIRVNPAKRDTHKVNELNRIEK